MPEPWSTAADRVGGVAALAKELQVGTTTLHRWAQGTMRPRGLTVDAVNAWFARRGLDKPFEDKT
jgi:hypothetical protein